MKMPEFAEELFRKQMKELFLKTYEAGYKQALENSKTGLIWSESDIKSFFDEYFNNFEKGK